MKTNTDHARDYYNRRKEKINGLEAALVDLLKTVEDEGLAHSNDALYVAVRASRDALELFRKRYAKHVKVDAFGKSSSVFFCGKGHPLSDDNISFIVKSTGVLERKCKRCHADRQIEYRALVRAANTKARQGG